MSVPEVLRRLISKTDEGTKNVYATAPRSFASLYPEVPLPDVALSPILLAAQWMSHELYGQDMPKVAIDLLEAGYETPAMIRLAGETEITHSSDAEPLVGAMFRELGVQYPLSDLTAKLIATRQIAREVIAGVRNSWAAVSHIKIVIWNRIAETEEVDALFSIADELDWDAPERRSLALLDSELIRTFADLGTLKLENYK
jgi:hypothetical protein